MMDTSAILPAPFLWPHPFCFKLESSKFLSRYCAHSASPISRPFPQASLPSSYPGPSKWQGSLSFKERRTVFFLVQRPSVPAGVLLASACLLSCQFLKKFTGLLHSVFSCQDNSHSMDGELPKEQDFIIAFSPELPTMILKSSIADSCRTRLIYSYRLNSNWALLSP